MMPEEGKTDSESSCLLFEKEKRLSERMHYVCGENGLGKQLSPLRKKKSDYPKECIMFTEKTDSESSCSFFGKRKAVTRKNALCLRRKRTRKAVVPSSEKEKRLSERMNCVCRKYALRPLGGVALFYPSDVFPFHSGDLHSACGWKIILINGCKTLAKRKKIG